MTISTLKNNIKSGNIDKFYVFVGEEIEVMRLYIKQLSKATGKKIQVCDSVETAVKQMSKGSLLNETKIYYVLEDYDFSKQAEKIYLPFISGEVQRDNILVLRYISLDKRTKFYKAISDKTIEFESLKIDLIVSHLKKKCDLNTGNCEQLAKYCSNDYGRILLELDKILSFGGDVNEAFEILRDKKVISRDPEDAIFKLVDAILARDGRTALRLYDDCERIGESNIAILSVLYNNVKQLFQVQSCKSDNVQGLTGLSSWQIRNASKNKYKYADGVLVDIMKLIREIDSGIKAGRIDESQSVMYLLVNIFC